MPFPVGERAVLLVARLAFGIGFRLTRHASLLLFFCLGLGFLGLGLIVLLLTQPGSSTKSGPPPRS
eukprot:5392566-Prymnesium_polylepis.1